MKNKEIRDVHKKLSGSVHCILQFARVFPLIALLLGLAPAVSALPDANAANTVQQQLTIRGIITDAAGEPLPGVSIVIRGTVRGTTSGLDGTYSLAAVAPGEILQYSFVGMRTREIVVDRETTLNVVMVEDFLGLEEVVAVGYGYQRRETLTGAITSIQADELQVTKSGSLAGNIQGRLPGIHIRQRTHEPGEFSSMMSIRGFGTPLIVIDGVARDGTSEFERLNPEDVESISVLKDASAAIYGMNAANGVIIVTTKRGQAGKTKFNYFTYNGLKTPTGMEETVDAYTYRLMRNEMERNIGNPPQFSQEILEKYRLGTEPGYQDVNWIDLTLHNWVFQQQHNFSVRGGSDRVQNFTSLGYTEDNGILKSNIQKYRRYNFRSNTTSQLTDNLSATVSVSGRYDQNTSPRIGYLWVFKPIMVNDRGYNYHVIGDPSKMALIPPENTNPWALMHEDIDGYQKYSNMQYQSSIDLRYEAPFLDGLTFNLNGAYDGNIGQTSNLQLAYYQYDYVTGEPGGKVSGVSRYSSNHNLFRRMNLQAQVAYRQTFNQAHNVRAMLVHEVRETMTNTLGAQRQYDDLFTHDIINQGSTTNMQNSGSRFQTGLVAYLGRFNYDYMGKYMLEAAFRYDGSYRYSPNQRWSLFPSASIGWRVSEESFIKDNLTFISHLRLRSSIGKSGIDAGTAHQYIAGYTFGGIGGGYVFNPGQLTIGMVPPGVVNDYLSWESTTTANIGIDFDLWNAKLGGSFDVFERRREGMLATKVQSVPNTFGGTFPQENLNSDLHHGFEMVLSHRNRISNLNYSISANATYSRRKLLHTERAPYTSTWQMWKDNQGSNRYTGRLWAYDYDGRYTSIEQYETAPLMGGTNGNSRLLPGSWALLDVNGDGVINSNDQLPILWAGQGNPPLQYGLNMAASYKSWDLSVLFQGSALYTIVFRNNDIWGYGRYPSLHVRYMDRWHTADPAADPYDPATTWISGEYPALRSNFTGTMDGQVFDQWVIPANYLRLKTLELGYTIPDDFARRLRMENVRLFVNGYNLYTWTNDKIKQIDPEKHEADWNANLTYPLMMSFNFGLNVNF